jgi:hypothetical protein
MTAHASDASTDQRHDDKNIPDPTLILLKSSDGNDASSKWVAEMSTHRGPGSTTTPSSMLRKPDYDTNHDDGHAPFTRTEVGGANAGRGRRRCLSHEDGVRSRSQAGSAGRHVVAWTDGDKRAKDAGAGAKREFRTADAAHARYEETTTVNKTGQPHTFRSTISDRTPRGGVVPTNKTAHAAATVNDETISAPVPILLKAGDTHGVDRAATAAMAEATAKAGDPNMAGGEEGNTRRSNSAPRVDGRSLGIPAAVAARSDVDKECANKENVVDTYTKSEALALNAAASPHCSSTAVLLAHALLLGLGLGLLGCACVVLLLPVLLLLLPRVLGRLGCPPRPRRPRRTPSTSRCRSGPPHCRLKLTRMRMKHPPFWVCALALLSRYFSLVGAAPLTDATFKQASWGT